MGRVKRSLLKSRIAPAVDRLFLYSTSYSNKTRPKELYSLSILPTLFSITCMSFILLSITQQRTTYLVPFYHGRTRPQSDTAPVTSGFKSCHRTRRYTCCIITCEVCIGGGSCYLTRQVQHYPLPLKGSSSDLRMCPPLAPSHKNSSSNNCKQKTRNIGKTKLCRKIQTTANKNP